MGKLTLKSTPTFAGKVNISVAGAAPAAVGFVFRHRTRAQLDAYLSELQAAGPVKGLDAEVGAVLAVIEGWDLDEPFTPENVRTFLDNHHNAAWSIGTGYLAELIRAKEGN